MVGAFEKVGREAGLITVLIPARWCGKQKPDRCIVLFDHRGNNM